jgi:3-isopropylmalate/(R)-2-methylmalate dehydratase small subunit
MITVNEMVNSKIIGTAWCFGDNVNTDLIYPGRFLSLTEPEEMGKHAMAGLDDEFMIKTRPGDFIVGGLNFGSGSSREQAAIAIKYAGITVVIARSFARIFFRNIINQGVLAITCDKAFNLVKDNDTLELDLKKGVLKNLNNGQECTFDPIPDFLMEIIEDGGCIPHLRKKLDHR